MTEQNQIYKCNSCGNIVTVLHAGEGQLVCCGEEMELLTEKTKDEGHEKHLPVISKTENGIRVQIGSNAHPMEEEHYIEWIEVILGDRVCRKLLKPGAKPEAEFEFAAEKVQARGYCNVHGLWKKD